MHNSVQSFAREAPIQPKSVSQQERHNHVGGGKQTRPPPFDLYCWTLVVPPPSSIHSNNNNIAAGLDVGVCGWCTYAITWWGPPFFGQNIYFFSRLGGCPTFLGKHSAKPSPLPFAILPSLPEVRNWGNKKRILWILVGGYVPRIGFGGAPREGKHTFTTQHREQQQHFCWGALSKSKLKLMGREVRLLTSWVFVFGKLILMAFCWDLFANRIRLFSTLEKFERIRIIKFFSSSSFIYKRLKL